MQSGLITVLRSKGLAAAVHAALWVLLALALTHIGGTAPEYRDAAAHSMPAVNSVPVNRLGNLFSVADWPGEVLNTNLPGPFFTTAFLPVPKPPPPPPPPPPTTRKVTLVYQGFHETAGGPRIAAVKTAEGFAMTPIGGQTVTNHFAAEITMHALTLTNTAGSTNLLLLNVPTEVEIPVK